MRGTLRLPHLFAIAASILSSSSALALAPPADCPSDLSVDTHARTVDTRPRPAGQTRADYARYQKMKWAPNHRAPAPASFADPSAIETVLRIEARQPTLLPKAFRAELLAHPRDAALRLRVAACEVARPATRRRASYDAALALVFGARRDQAEPLLLESTRNQDGNGNTVSSCWKGRCDGNQTCVDGACLSPLGAGALFISKAELAIEDALTHALFATYRERNGDAYTEKDPLYWWMNRRLHQCGAQVCNFAGYSSKLVEWDLRDGGSASGFLTEAQARAERERLRASGCEACKTQLQRCLRGEIDPRTAEQSCADQYEECFALHRMQERECR